MKKPFFVAIFAVLLGVQNTFAQNWLQVDSLKLDLNSFSRQGTETTLLVDQGNGPKLASIDCQARKIQFAGTKGVYVPNGSPEGFILSVACTNADPNSYPADYQPKFCNAQNIGWEKLVCENKDMRLAERESNLLYEKALAQCKNKIDVLRYKRDWLIATDSCKSNDCLHRAYFKQDNAFAILLNSLPNNRMCTVDGAAPTISMEFLKKSTEIPADHAYDNYMNCSFKTAAQMDDQTSGADVIGRAVYASCIESAKLWAFAVQQETGSDETYSRFLSQLKDGPINANVVLTVRKIKREEQSKTQPVVPPKVQRSNPVKRQPQV